MANRWTKEQKQAIDARGSDLLIAAAAGSGKTAVAAACCYKNIRAHQTRCIIRSCFLFLKKNPTFHPRHSWM